VSIIATVALQHTPTTAPPPAGHAHHLLPALLTVYATFSLYSLAAMLQRFTRQTEINVFCKSVPLRKINEHFLWLGI